MERRITELEKTILLAFLSISKGKAKPIKEDEVVMKFPAVQRHFARSSIERLVREGFLLRHTRNKSYILSERGLRGARRALVEGARII